MSWAANNPETHAFAESYRETTTVEGRGEDYGFLQDADSADDDDDEDEDPGHRRIKERMDAVDRQAYIVREIKRRKKAQANEDWDEYEEVSLSVYFLHYVPMLRQVAVKDEPVFLNGVSSSSPPPQPQYKIKIKDRTEATRPAPKNIYKDTYEDIEVCQLLSHSLILSMTDISCVHQMEYSYFSREEPAHIQKIRAQEAVEGSSKSDSFSRRAGQSSSVTSMAARKPAVSTLKTTSATSAVPREQAQSHRSKAPPSRGLGKSLSEARTAGFRR